MTVLLAAADTTGTTGNQHLAAAALAGAALLLFFLVMGRFRPKVKPKPPPASYTQLVSIGFLTLAVVALALLSAAIER